MDFGHDERTNDLIGTLTQFLAERIYPAEATLHQQLAADPQSWSPPAVVRELQQEAQQRGLWNLFLPTGPQGLSNVQYAPLAELSGRSMELTFGRPLAEQGVIRE